MAALTTAQKRRNARRALAHTAMGRAAEGPGKVEAATSTFTNPVAEPRRTSPPPKSSSGPQFIGRDESTIVGENANREVYDRPLPQAPVKAPKAPRLARAQPISTERTATTQEPEEPTIIGGGRVGLPAAATSQRINKPANYKLHVLSALLLAVSIRLAAHGTKALTG